MKLAELGTGLDSDLFGQGRAELPIRAQRVRLPAATIERQESLVPEPLAQRMRHGQRLELGEYLVVAPTLQLGLDPRFERAEPLLLEPRPLGSGKAAVAHVGERRPPPQTQRPIEELHSLCRIATCDRRPPRAHELLELEHVELVDGDVEHVAGRPGDQPIGFTGGAQRTAELRQAYLKIGRAPLLPVLGP